MDGTKGTLEKGQRNTYNFNAKQEKLYEEHPFVQISEWKKRRLEAKKNGKNECKE